MKKFRLLIVAVLLSVSFSVFAVSSLANKHKVKYKPAKEKQHKGAIGAPLDGGLLALLAAGGVAYYVGRKRNKSSKE
jgi:UDP-N-acetylmuramyl pentapeptide phosphotransferase/UDP-N-acetylglucosamine-1-phosphate transferase